MKKSSAKTKSAKAVAASIMPYVPQTKLNIFSETNVTKMTRLPSLYLKHTANKGRGVYCLDNIKAGTDIEVTPAIVLNEKATTQVDKTLMVDYTFVIGDVSNPLRRAAGIKNIDESSVIVMGMASFCNHCENNNAEILWEEHDGTLYYTLRATRDIPRNTEICTTYGTDWFDERN
jgi:hypothetical protein